MKIVKTSPSNHTFAKRIIGSCAPVPAAWVAALMGLVSILSVQAVVLDNFSGAIHGWTTTPYLNGGTIVQSGGQLQVATAAAANDLTYGIKTASNYVNAASQTLEFRVDVTGVTPGSGDPNPVAILAWLPSGAVPGSGSSGYSLWVSPGSATLMQGATPLATTSYTPYTTNLQGTTLMLRMTPGSGNISVNARVYHQTGSLPMQDFTEVWEYTWTGSGSVGTGNAALGVQSGASASGATVSFDNLQVFVLSDSVLDDFSGGSADLAANYSVSGYPAVATISGGQMELATPVYNTTLYAAARRATSNYEITDGSRLEISVDVANFGPGASDSKAFGAFGFLPFNNDNGIGYLIGYHIGASSLGLVMGKCYGEWWVNQEPFSPPGPEEPIPSTNVRLIISMTGEGTSCRIDSRVEDLSQGVNSATRLLYQNVFVDTVGSDPLDSNTTPDYPDGAVQQQQGLSFGGSPAGAYINTPGSIALYAFYGGSAGYADVIFKNLVVNQTAPTALPPSFSNFVPADRSNFVAVATGVSFNVNDAINTPVNNISLTLNGVRYANGSGATVGTTATSRTFTLSPNPLAPDRFYSGTMVATNSSGLVTTLNYSFDTFTTNNCYVVESEDWNFSSDEGVTGGSFIDNPALYPNNWGPLPDGYVRQIGVPEVDYHDAQGSGNSGSTYRPTDNPRTSVTGDGPRQKYIDADVIYPPSLGGPVPETILVDRQNGDWNNYTHTYPAGSYYTAYLRMSQYNLPNSVIGLEQVTNPTLTNGLGQSSVSLGVFLGTPRGYDINFDVPLTDALGNLLTNRFPTEEPSTLRVNNILVQGTSSDLWQNYLVFAPAGNPGSLGPYVSGLVPAAGQALGVNAPLTNSATLVNRTTTVDLGSPVTITVNGSTVPSTAVATANGAAVTWAPVAPAPTVITTLAFKDSASVPYTITWTNTYSAVLQAASSLPVGSLTTNGFDARLVVSYSTSDPTYANIGQTIYVTNGATITTNVGIGNGVGSAQAVLSLQYPVNFSSTNIVQTVNWDIISPDTNYPSITGNFPGLCANTANPNSFAVEVFAYLQLTTGLNRFYVDSDDEVGIYSGTNLTDNSIVLLETAGVVHQSFDFYVPAPGLYPFHIIYEQGGGAAYLRLLSMNLSDSSTHLVNTAGGAPAFYPLIWKSSPVPSGGLPLTWTADTAANGAGNVLGTAGVPCDGMGGALNQSLTGGTNTFIPSASKLYRLDGPRASHIDSIKKVGANLRIIYTAQ